MTAYEDFMKLNKTPDTYLINTCFVNNLLKSLFYYA
nr:MAG TPA: ubiquitin carboxyl-terminal hydrolase [Bacteriophage sp.]